MPRRCLPFADRFWRHVEKGDGCWNWTASLNDKGYGLIWHDGKTKSAHRVAFEISKGPIPLGLCVCHACDNPRCVNPAHLWLGTPSDNQKDSVRKGRHAIESGRYVPKGVSRPSPRPRWTHCRRGHEMTAENTYMSSGDPKCRTCRRDRDSSQLAHLRLQAI